VYYSRAGAGVARGTRCVLLLGGRGVDYSWARRGKVCITPGVGGSSLGAGEVRITWGSKECEVCITPGGEVCITPGAGKARCALLRGWGGRGQGDEVCITPGGARCVLLLGQERQGVYYSRGGRVLLGGRRGAYDMGLERG
jgi:hypothetical protein